MLFVKSGYSIHLGFALKSKIVHFQMSQAGSENVQQIAKGCFLVPGKISGPREKFLVPGKTFWYWETNSGPRKKFSDLRKSSGLRKKRKISLVSEEEGEVR